MFCYLTIVNQRLKGDYVYYEPLFELYHLFRSSFKYKFLNS